MGSQDQVTLKENAEQSCTVTKIEDVVNNLTVLQASSDKEIQDTANSAIRQLSEIAKTLKVTDTQISISKESKETLSGSDKEPQNPVITADAGELWYTCTYIYAPLWKKRAYCIAHVCWLVSLSVGWYVGLL